MMDQLKSCAANAEVTALNDLVPTENDILLRGGAARAVFDFVSRAFFDLKAGLP
jgi:hypothetical protein